MRLVCSRYTQDALFFHKGRLNDNDFLESIRRTRVIVHSECGLWGIAMVLGIMRDQEPIKGQGVDFLETRTSGMIEYIR